MTYQLPTIASAATGGSLSATLVARFGRRLNVIDDFGAKGDVQFYPANGSGTAGSNLFAPNNSVTPSSADIGKKLVVYGAGSGGVPYVGAITGVSGSAWTISPNLPQTVGLSAFIGIKIATAQSGSGSYAPGDTITLTGGTTTGGSQPVLGVKYTMVESATVGAGGSGGTNGTQTVSGTTGEGIVFQASVTVSGGAITAVNSIAAPGVYTGNPTSLTAEPVTGGGLSGATLNLKMGVAAAYIVSPGGYSASPSNPVSQGSTSGSGTGAKFTITYWTPGLYGSPGGFYYGTDDTTAIQAAAAWVNANSGTILVPPQKFAISGTITVTASQVAFVGEGSGYYNRPNTNTPPAYGSSFWWAGSAGGTMASIVQPSGANTNKLGGSGFQNLAFVGGNVAGYGLSAQGIVASKITGLLFERFTTSPFDINAASGTNDSTSAQQNEIARIQINQDGVIGDAYLGRLLFAYNGGNEGNFSLNDVRDIFMLQGPTTVFQLHGVDNNWLRNIDIYCPSYAGGVYSTEVTADPQYPSNTDWFIGYSTSLPMVVRGTQSLGSLAAYDIWIIGRDSGNSTPPTVVEPGAIYHEIDSTGSTISIGPAWQNWTPVFSNYGGTSVTITPVSARYAQQLMTVNFNLIFEVTATSGSPFGVAFTLPTNAANQAAFTGYESSGGNILSGTVPSGSNSAHASGYNGNFPGTPPAFWTVSGTYESQT